VAGEKLRFTATRVCAAARSIGPPVVPGAVYRCTHDTTLDRP
jgi:hypothetical protein